MDIHVHVPINDNLHYIALLLIIINVLIVPDSFCFALFCVPYCLVF